MSHLSEAARDEIATVVGDTLVARYGEEAARTLIAPLSHVMHALQTAGALRAPGDSGHCCNPNEPCPNGVEDGT